MLCATYMGTQIFDIKNNLKIGEEIFENIPNDIRPRWGLLILSRFDNYIKDIPTSIKELYPIIENQERWRQAHGQFSKIRKFLLNNKSYKPEAYLLLAENVAKITYNATGDPAPFDYDSGWYIPICALKAAEVFEDDRLEEDVKAAILLFSRNEKFKVNLSAAKEYLIYKKIDDILWFDWDPIGIIDMAPRDEYQGYVPEIYNLKKSGAQRDEIAARLFKLQVDRMGVTGDLERLKKIADKIIQVK